MRRVSFMSSSILEVVTLGLFYSIPSTTLTSPFAHGYPQPSRYEWIDLPLASEPFIGLHVL
jgi:hypothetical protein